MGEVQQIRPATLDDLPAIVDIHNALIETTTYEWTESPHTLAARTDWFHRQQEAGFPVLVAEEDGQVVGWATFGWFRDAIARPGYRFTVEHTVHVAGTHHGRGWGRRLVAALVDEARSQGRRVMVAAICGSNEPSIRFHEHLGFVETARMPGVGEKWGRPLDLVLLQLELTDHLG